MLPRKPFLLIGLLVVVLAAACQPAQNTEQPAPADRITFMAGYKPQANLPFVGVYVAEQQGFFAEENLQVEIQHSSGQGEHLQLLTAGEVQVTTQDAAVLLQRRADPGLPLVSIALIGQRGQQAYAALAGSGCARPSIGKGAWSAIRAPRRPIYSPCWPPPAPTPITSTW